MKQVRKRRFAELLNGAPYNGDRKAFMKASGLSKGRITQLLDPDEPFGDVAVKNLVGKLGLEDDYFDKEPASSAAFANLSAFEAILIGLIRKEHGLNEGELIQLIEAVKAAVETKNARVITGNEHVTTNVYFGIERRSISTPVRENRRQTGWTINSPHGSLQEGSRKERGGRK